MKSVKHKSKLNGAVFTPPYLANIILDMAGYTGNVLKKHVMDNSCGDGAFLILAVQRYCETFLKQFQNAAELKNQLETYFHGIDNDSDSVKQCIANLNAAAKNYGVENVHWDVSCADTLKVTKYNGLMDFVVGNPPLHPRAQSGGFV